MKVEPRLMAVIEGWIAEGRAAGRVPLIGLSGCQGSGKSTLADAACKAFGAAGFSIDDVYLTRAERNARMVEFAPIFGMRGPPGTHDLGLALKTIEALQAAGAGSRTAIPSFDKIADDRKPEAKWPVYEGRPSAVIFDAWCLGALPQAEGDLIVPVNVLEVEADPDGAWRRDGNRHLREDYADFFARFDRVLFLKAPGFHVVKTWRTQQEATLHGVTVDQVPEARKAELDRFVQHYERVTRHMLAGGVRCDVTAELDEGRKVGTIR